MPRVARSDLTMNLVRRYETDPADTNPNIAGVSPGDPGTINLQEKVGDSSQPVRGFAWGYYHDDVDTRITAIPWIWDPTSGRWWESLGDSGIEPDQLYLDNEIGDCTLYLQMVETSGTTTIDADHPLDSYVAEV